MAMAVEVMVSVSTFCECGHIDVIDEVGRSKESNDTGMTAPIHTKKGVHVMDMSVMATAVQTTENGEEEAFRRPVPTLTLFDP